MWGRALHKKILFGRRGGNGKNKKPFNNVKKRGFREVYAEYIVEGVNIPTLLNKLKRSGVSVYSVKRVERNAVILWVKINEEQKFFAIIENLCYNVKKVKNRGKFLFLYELISAPTALLGALIFTVLSVIFSGLIMGVTFVGNGSVYSEEVNSYLHSQGVKEKTFFQSVDLDNLANGILSSFDEFSFVSCKKRGNTLLIELILAENETHIKADGQKDLYADLDGVVEEIKIYRGTSNVKIGDEVKKGDLLVSGFMEIKEKRVEVNALAQVTLTAKKEFTYISASDKDSEAAIAFALSSFARECDSAVVDRLEENGEYYYKVTVYYKRVIYTG